MSKLTEVCPSCGSMNFTKTDYTFDLYLCAECSAEFREPAIEGSTVDDDTPKIKDSGVRREFETGAVRDISEGKGRCDLLPLDVVSGFYSLDIPSKIFSSIEHFKKSKDVDDLFYALRLFGEYEYSSMSDMFLELSKHFEEGATKYGENNWKKGIPLHCYIDSAIRHLFKYVREDTDEPHERAFVWNLVCAIWTVKNRPELDDIERDLKVRIDPIKEVNSCLGCRHKGHFENESENGYPSPCTLCKRRVPDNYSTEE